MDVSKCTDYVQIIRMILEENSGIKGYQSQIAKAAGFHNSHFSSVLNGKAHLTAEQALAVANFWKFDYLLTELFLTLVSLAKAGTSKLKDHLENRVNELRPKLTGSDIYPDYLVENRRELDPSDAIFFWSTWHCGAIQAYLMTPRKKAVPDIAAHLLLPEVTVRNALNRMATMGLAKENDDGTWYNRNADMIKHPSNDILELFHASVRLRGNNFNKRESDLRELRATFIAVVSKNTAKSMRETLYRTIKNQLDMVNAPALGDETEIIAVCADLYEM